MNILENVYFLIKQLRVVITLNRDIWDSVAIAVVRDLLYDNYKTTTESILKQRNNIINEIQQILASIRRKFIKNISLKSIEIWQ